MTEKITIPQFCYWHIKTVESTTSCTAHLNEGRCFECPYTPEEMYVTDEGRLRIAHKPDQYIGVCEDFGLIEPERKSKNIEALVERKLSEANLEAKSKEDVKEE